MKDLPSGVAVYLSPEEIEAHDEYANADPYAVEEGGSFHAQRIELTVDMVRHFAKGGDRILDVGCGQGHITHAIQKALPSARISGFDCSVSAIRYAHAHFPGISFAVADAIASPYPEGPFDIVICNNLWEHVSNPMGLLERMRQALEPGGIVIISTPSRYRVSNLLRAALGRRVALMSSHHVTEYSVGQMEEMLRWGGFTVERIASRPGGSLKSRMALALGGALTRFLKSHHRFEATVFYAARRPQA